MKTINTLGGLLGMTAFFLAAIAAVAQTPATTALPTPKPFFPLPPPSVSTVPSNGDVNPYGVAFVPWDMATGWTLQPGDVLVSNFNNNLNLQGTGSTIIRVSESGQTSLFFQGQKGLGLTAALGVVRAGYVFVGNMPTTDGTSATVQAGSLLILDANGKLLFNFSQHALFDGPWGMAINDFGEGAQVFISNVLSGAVIRLDMGFTPNHTIELWDAVTIESGFSHRTDPAALVLGPSGLAFDAVNDILYIASSADNAIYSVPGAGQLTTSVSKPNLIYQDNTHLHGPLDVVLLPNGHLVVANSDGSNATPNQPSELVEFTTTGTFVAEYSVDPNNGGAFGIGSQQLGRAALRFAAVDDNQNTLNLWTESLR